MLSLNKFIFLLAFICSGSLINAQQRVQPKWWFGESVAANFNNYRGMTQMLNSSLMVPTAFHKGDGIRPYASLLAEYRPGKVFGGMLNVAYDNRGGKFAEVMAPCNCAADLSTNVSYITVEPSLRIAPFSNGFYIFGGPTISFNITKSFTYIQDKQSDKHGDLSNMNATTFSGQAGAGFDIPISAKSSGIQMTLSPFASFLTDFGHDPRTVESWSVYTVRAGIALKMGKGRKSAKAVDASITSETTPVALTTVVSKDINFSVRAPKVVPASRQVKETFPLRNSVFFTMGSTEIPSRYVLLTPAQAASFKESQLQQAQPDNLNNGRSARQLAVYHNILNIIGDRLRSNPMSSVLLTGSSDKNPAEGKLMADNIKQYLVSSFGITPSRITTEGRDKPVIPSEQPGAVKDLALLREGDRRVDIMSTSTEMLMQVGGKTSPFLKPVEFSTIQEDPLDSHVIFNALGASESLKSWKIDATDDQGNVQHFGPFTNDQASVPGKAILGNNNQGNYKIVMIGETKTGETIRRESSVSLIKKDDLKQQGLRYSILFDFDKSKSITAYENFLTDVVAPLIPDNGRVIIHGHTDIIGEEAYNLNLSHDRAMGAQRIIEQALQKAGKTGVKFETYGFGKDASMAPFENNLVEERFYNRTVIIDILTN